MGRADEPVQLSLLGFERPSKHQSTVNQFSLPSWLKLVQKLVPATISVVIFLWPLSSLFFLDECKVCLECLQNSWPHKFGRDSTPETLKEGKQPE